MNNITEKLLHEFQTPFTNSVLVFSLILFIILLVPIIFARFRIPGIIGLIISGALIGPHGFELIRRNAAVDLFSTIGLLYIMFIAGLDLNLEEFRKTKSRSVVFGILTFTIPIALGVPLCYYLLDYGMNTSVLVASMFATHTLIAYPIVNRLGITKNQAVAVAVGGTILTDTAVLVLLAVISGSRVSGLTREFWMGLLVSLAVFVVIVVFIVPRISSWFFKRLEDEKYAHFIFVLSVVFFCAFMAELAGLEPIIGAFAAGITLNRLIPHTTSLMNRIEFVGNSLFIPFFLISVGMLVDVSVLARGPQALVIAFSLTIAAIFGKWIAAQLTGMIFRYTQPARNVIFGLSTSHAAATLAVILVGYNIGLIDDNILNGTIVLILVTCVVASFVTENAGKKLLLEMNNEPEMIVSAQRIIVPISNPKTMEKLIDFGILIKNQKQEYPIIALTVVKDDDQAQEKLLQSRKLLEKAIIHAASADQKIEMTATIDRNVISGIRRVIKEKFVTDIVLGWSDETNIADIIFGRTFDILIKQTAQNVFITRFAMPLNVHKKIVLICPAFAEKEMGFYKWIESVLQLSVHLRLALHLYGDSELHKDVQDYIEMNRFTVTLHYKGSIDPGAIVKLREIDPSDLLILATSREGGISYNSVLDILPRKLSKSFPQNNLVFIYPETANTNAISNYEEEVTGGMIQKGVEIIRTAGKIFRRKDT